MLEPTPFDNISLRSEQPADEPIVYEIYASTRREELGLTNLDEASSRVILQMQFRAMRDGYAAMFPAADYSLIVRDTSILGRVVIDRSEEDIHLVDVALLHEYRNQGIGTWLIRNLQDDARKSRRPLRLRVAADNPAAQLYERLGFHEIRKDAPYRHMEWKGH